MYSFKEFLLLSEGEEKKKKKTDKKKSPASKNKKKPTDVTASRKEATHAGMSFYGPGEL